MITRATRGGLVAVVAIGMGIFWGSRRAAAQGFADVAAPPPVPRAPAVVPAAPPRALWGVSADLSGYGIRHVDKGYRVLGKRDDRVGAGVEASYDTLRFGRSGRLAFGLGFVSDRVGPSQDPADLQISFQGTSYFALAQARWRAGAKVQPYLLLGAGLTHATMSVDNNASSGELRGKANAGFARAGGGVRFVPAFLTIKKDGQPVLGFTLTLEAGAVVGGNLAFDLRANSRSPDATGGASDPIAVDPTRAGNLGTTASYARLGVGLVF